MTATPEAARVSPEAFELTRTAIAENRLDDAERMSDRMLLMDPKNLEARLLRGEVLLAKGRPNRAMAIFSGFSAASVAWSGMSMMASATNIGPKKIVFTATLLPPLAKNVETVAQK